MVFHYQGLNQEVTALTVGIDRDERCVCQDLLESKDNHNRITSCKILSLRPYKSYTI